MAENEDRNFEQPNVVDKNIPFPKKLYEEYENRDEKSNEIAKKMEERRGKMPKTLLENAEEEKMGVEKRLEDSDKYLSELILLGNELVTNIKVANDKREILRRNYEAIKRDELLSDIQKESIEAAAKLEAITSKWTELEEIKEPMGLYEELALQKKRITDLMNEKDGIIKECQMEIMRADQKYYSDLERQTADIYCLVERIDNQIEIIKNAYKDHLELLQQTIENERKNLAVAAVRKWNELYEKRSENERMKIITAKEKSDFYASEIERISLEHQELTRSTRIRLEKDAEALQIELRNVKNNVMLNSEKLDYNYQVLQKRDEENIIIRNQQKRRLSKLNEMISQLKKTINDTKINSNIEIKKLTSEVQHLNASIKDLENKAENFSNIDDKKYQTVWDLNNQEATELLKKVLEIDRLLHEQQLGLKWYPPEMPFKKIDNLPSNKSVIKQASQKNDMKFDPKRKFSTIDKDNDDQKIIDNKMLRNILRKISDRAGFLVEEKVNEILKPYTENEKVLVRIDNIFNALGIKDMNDVNSLIEYFIPYSWCPNCSEGLSPNITDRLNLLEFEQIQFRDTGLETTGLGDTTRKIVQLKDLEKSQELMGTDEVCSLTLSNGIDNQLYSFLQDFGNAETSLDMKSSSQFKNSSKEIQQKCRNHFFVIEHAFVLTALREFIESHLCKLNNPFGASKSRTTVLPQQPYKQRSTMSRLLTKTDVEMFWSQFRNVFPEQKQKLWKALEKGLNNYLSILKERETLDTECEFLRKQNTELRHLLQKYLPQ